MNYDQDKTAEKLKHVPVKDRVFIYNATTILEFLNKTFMPTYYFLNQEGAKRMGPGVTIEKRDLNNPDDLDNCRFTLGEIYDFYKMYRQQSDYTSEIESRYKFSIILKKLSYFKNGWKLNTKRVGRAQFVYFSPLLLRIKVPVEVRKDIPPANPDLLKSQVTIEPEDLNETETEEETETRFKEVFYEVEEDTADDPHGQVDEEY